ncbi:hypothetical protein H8E88_24065 [candidate division KSB1 bacterium]|nr:hypothetical protein [candidate division KSB1 bacterium]
MKIQTVIALVILMVTLLIGRALFYLKGGYILQMGAEQSLKMTRSQVEKALPTDFPADKIMKEFNVTLEKAKASKINKKKLKNLLIQMPAKLEDGKLDSVEVDSLIQQLRNIIDVQQK